MMNTKMIARLMAVAALTAATSASVFAAEPQQEGAMAATSKTVESNDAAITTKIKSVLADQKQIGVTTSEGVVVLTGSVASTDAGTKAIQQASAVAGVKEVKSELTVASK
jgi:hyperosmotically inducible protein